MENQVKQKPKAVFIDGASFSHMLRAIGIWSPKTRELYEVLEKEVGTTSSLYGRPLYVCPEEYGGFPEKPYNSAGFEVIRQTTEGSLDDEEIRKTINSISSEQISELVLVTCDLLDYLDCLKAKAIQGVRIYIVATREPDAKDGCSRLTGEFDQLMEENGFIFIELAQYKEKILFRPFYQNEDGNGKKNDSSVKFSAEIEFSGDSETAARLATALNAFFIQFPSLQVTTRYKS